MKKWLKDAFTNGVSLAGIVPGNIRPSKQKAYIHVQASLSNGVLLWASWNRNFPKTDLPLLSFQFFEICPSLFSLVFHFIFLKMPLPINIHLAPLPIASYFVMFVHLTCYNVMLYMTVKQVNVMLKFWVTFYIFALQMSSCTIHAENCCFYLHFSCSP